LGHEQLSEAERRPPVYVADAIAGNELPDVAGFEALADARRHVVADRGLCLARARQAPQRKPARIHAQRPARVRRAVDGLEPGPVPETRVHDAEARPPTAATLDLVRPADALIADQREEAVMGAGDEPERGWERLEELQHRHGSAGAHRDRHHHPAPLP